MRLKANKLAAVILILAAALFTGCADKNTSPGESELTRSVITAAEATGTSKAETPATTAQTATAEKQTAADAEKQTTQEAQTTKKKKSTKKKKTTTTAATEENTPETANDVQKDVRFRSKKLLDSHYEKHGIEMGFESAKEYEKAACAVVNSPDALHKTEKEDGDDVYYIESSNEFVVVSKDGYLRTYFNPSKGKAYYDKQ